MSGISYPVSAQNVSFSYDAGADGIGRLTGMQDESGSTSFQYDARGNLVQKADTIAGHAFTVSYGYDADDNLTGITYPDGTQVTYNRDAAERISSVVSSSGGTVVTSITYEPFGPVTGLTYGNGLAETRTYDQDYRLTGITVPAIESWSLGYNADDDINGITDNLNNSNNQTLGYDTLNRLNAGSGNYGSLSYIYDADGNRSSSTVNGTTTSFTYGTTDNRLAKVNSTAWTYDADGNTTKDGTYTYAYDDTGRLSGVTKTGLTVSYLYNGLGQRAEKTVNGTTTVFIYDEAGQLLGEYTPSGTLIEETLWLNDRPIGVITPNGLYYVQTDQLNTPTAITNSSKQLVWEWNSDPFGTSAPNQNPSGLGTFTYNLRFPGQYYDAETGKNYNYFRDYDPSIGRYIESDPAGLAGGINTYGYVSNNPMRFHDPLGLDSFDFAHDCGAKICFGFARALQGNAHYLSKPTYGAYKAQGIQITADSAAAIPAQFGFSGSPAFAPYVDLVHMLVGGSSPMTINDISDTIGGKSPIPGTPVRDALQELNPGFLILELPGAKGDLGLVPVVLSVPAGVPCPVGTSQVTWNSQ